MVDSFRISDLRQMVESSERPCVTICMPTHVVGKASEQDAVRLRNLADRAERQLADRWLRAPEARDLIAPVRNLPADRGFWDMRSHGLALFLDSGSLRRFRVPLCLDELALVNRRFNVKPVLPLLTSGHRFFILSFSQNRVRLFEATQYQVEQIDVIGLPQRMDEALNLDGADRGSQSHFAMKGGKGKQSSVFHGQGGSRDSHKEELAQFFRMIDAAIMPVLRDENAPLVLAAVEYLLPIFRKVCHYAHLAEPELVGNWDHLSARQIHEKAWPLIEPQLSESRIKAAAKFRRLAGTGKACDGIREALPAAFEGRIETLFAASNRQIWGLCDPRGHVIEIQDGPGGNDDLLETAAVQTLLHDGTVYAVDSGDVPSSETLAAVMRF